MNGTTQRYTTRYDSDGRLVSVPVSDDFDGFGRPIEITQREIERREVERQEQLDYADGCRRCANWIFGNGVSCSEHGE